MKTRNLLAAAAVCGLIVYSFAPVAGRSIPGTFNLPGNILIADQFNNRVIEVDGRAIVWSLGLGPHDLTAKFYARCERCRTGRGRHVDGGDRYSAESRSVLQKSRMSRWPRAACRSQRQDRLAIWDFGVTGSGADELNAPVQSTWTPDKTVYITDQGNQRIIEVDPNKNIRGNTERRVYRHRLRPIERPQFRRTSGQWPCSDCRRKQQPRHRGGQATNILCQLDGEGT